MGVSYLIILVAIGLIVSFINKRKREAIITGVLYALVSYIISYPSGLFLAEYMPTTNVVIQTNTITVAKDLLVGALIPMIIAFILCAITAVIGSNIAKAISNDDESEYEEVGYHFNRNESYDDSDDYYYDNIQPSPEDKPKNTRKERERLIKLTPIDKAKMKRREGEGDD